MSQSVQTKDFLCFEKCTQCTDKGCTPARDPPGGKCLERGTGLKKLFTDLRIFSAGGHSA
jgi:hypothetical protein